MWRAPRASRRSRNSSVLRPPYRFLKNIHHIFHLPRPAAPKSIGCVCIWRWRAIVTSGAPRLPSQDRPAPPISIAFDLSSPTLLLSVVVCLFQFLYAGFELINLANLPLKLQHTFEGR